VLAKYPEVSHRSKESHFTMTVDPTSLAPFPPATHEQWRHAVDGVLAKGVELSPEQLVQRFQRQLVSRTYEGLEIQPLYTALDVPVATHELPGQPPFTRSATPAGAVPNGWEVRQRVVVRGDGSAAAADALSELERGTTGLWLDVSANADAVDVDTLDRALTGIFLELVPITLDAGGALRPAEALTELWRRRNHGAHEAQGCLGVDPIGALMRRGGSLHEVDAHTPEVVALVQRIAATTPRVRTLVADATAWHDAGANDADELAGVLAAGVTYLRWLTDAGVDVGTALGQLELRIAATADQFLTIAKVRALRVLWHRLAEVSGGEPADRAARIHAVTSRAMTTRYDPWVNLLRTTVACFAAGVGGADAVSVSPYDHLIDEHAGGELGRRMARNTQAILLDESNLGRVIDPAGGSWYVEHLTQALADAAWSAFQEIEAAGGLLAAYDQGWVHHRVNASWQRRQADIATRKVPITGVSEFPNIDDEIPAPLAEAAGAAGELAPLPMRRHAEGFERLRGAADDHRRRTGTHPDVIVWGLGTPADSTARVTFAKNLFEAGGLLTRFVESLDAVDLTGRLVCLCSSDARYAELAADAARAAKAGGAARVYLAGRPADLVDTLQQAGVDEFVALGVDALDVLSRALTSAGVER